MRKTTCLRWCTGSVVASRKSIRAWKSSKTESARSKILLRSRRQSKKSHRIVMSTLPNRLLWKWLSERTRLSLASLLSTWLPTLTRTKFRKCWNSNQDPWTNSNWKAQTISWSLYSVWQYRRSLHSRQSSRNNPSTNQWICLLDRDAPASTHNQIWSAKNCIKQCPGRKKSTKWLRNWKAIFLKMKLSSKKPCQNYIKR